jgi:GntR family transcriptional repressor for pyruvate dehydrogenase complex
MTRADGVDQPATQVDHVEQAILAMLADEGLRPGDRLPAERDLVARTGASRAAVREALGRLARDGLLTSRRGSGTYVATVDVAAITAVRVLLEPAAAAGAATHRSAAQARSLERALEELEETLDSPAAFAAADAAIHAGMAAACGNQALRDVLDRLARSAAVSRAATSGRRAVRERTLHEMRALVAAVRDRRADAAREAMARHLAALAREDPAHRRAARRGSTGP